MSKTRITWLFLISVVACIAGGILVALGWFSNPTDVFVTDGAQIVGIRETTDAAALAFIGLVGAFILAVAALTGVAAWIGALLNTAGFTRKRWFVGIALLGVINCGLLGVLAYVVARPSAGSRTGTAPAISPASAA